jgi:hypothetical protein
MGFAIVPLSPKQATTHPTVTFPCLGNEFETWEIARDEYIVLLPKTKQAVPEYL